MLARLDGRLAAQAPPPAAGAPRSRRPRRGSRPFRVDIDLVTTDAIVRDGKDQFVADLSKDEFQIFEDGVKQDLAR